jgi:hypothetical protein
MPAFDNWVTLSDYGVYFRTFVLKLSGNISNIRVDGRSPMEAEQLGLRAVSPDLRKPSDCPRHSNRKFAHIRVYWVHSIFARYIRLRCYDIYDNCDTADTHFRVKSKDTA